VVSLVNGKQLIVDNLKIVAADRKGENLIFFLNKLFSYSCSITWMWELMLCVVFHHPGYSFHNFHVIMDFFCV